MTSFIDQKYELLQAEPEVTVKDVNLTEEKEERLAREKAQQIEEANIISWDNVQAMIDVDDQMAQQMQAERKGRWGGVEEVVVAEWCAGGFVEWGAGSLGCRGRAVLGNGESGCGWGGAVCSRMVYSLLGLVGRGRGWLWSGGVGLVCWFGDWGVLDGGLILVLVVWICVDWLGVDG
ncbi:hypothetical protein Tco_0797428 [Tanacetum coccineum]